MEFNSAPADPCSNTRRDDVWSEATSTESVEMLLKSDGQEEMMPAASIILATSVCKDQGSSAGHVESGIDLDTRNSDTMGPKDEVHEDPTQDKPLDDQLLLVEVSSLNSENAGLSFENPHNLTHNTLSGRSGISTIEGEHEPSDENVQEPKTIGCSKMAVLGASEALSQKNADVSLKICNESGHESHASTRTGIEDTVVLDGNTRKSSVDISDTPCFESRVENSVDTVAANLDCPKLEDSGSIPSNKECELLFPEGDEKTSPRASLQTGDLEIRTLTTSSNIPSRFGQHCVTSSRISDEMETEVDKTSCGSPTIISSSEPSGMETNDLEDAKGYEITEDAKAYVNASAFNNSISTSPTPRQLFTESQSQLIQLRALILVSGAVLQGNAPDYADMLSLFGLHGTWYSTWREAVEREAAEAAAMAAAEAAATSIGAKIDKKVAERRPFPRLLLTEPHIALPDWAIGRQQPHKNFFVLTPVKSRFIFTNTERRKQQEFYNYVTKELEQEDLTFEEAMNMCPIHGFWPQSPEEQLQLKYSYDVMKEFKDSDRDGYEEFLLSWISTNTISEDGTISLFKLEYTKHSMFGVLGQSQLLSCCVAWHREIDIAYRLSQIAQKRADDIHIVNLGGIVYRGLPIGDIHEELDLMGVPRRLLILTEYDVGVPIMWEYRFETDGDLRFVFNVYEPNPCNDPDLFVYF